MPFMGFWMGNTAQRTCGAEVVGTLLMDVRGRRGKVDIATSPAATMEWTGTGGGSAPVAYDAMVSGVGTPVEHPVLAGSAAYQRQTKRFSPAGSRQKG